MADSSIPTTNDAAASAQRRSALVIIVLTNFLLSFGFQLWRSLFNNFAVGELGVRADQMGLIQSIREIPGLMGFSVGLLALSLAEMRIAGLAVVLMGIGIASTGGTGSLPGLVASTLVMSIGPREITPNISLGQTINHIAAVTIPLVGGMVWETIGSRYTFLIGMGIVALLLVLVQRMRTERSGVTSLAAADR